MERHAEREAARYLEEWLVACASGGRTAQPCREPCWTLEPSSESAPLFLAKRHISPDRLKIFATQPEVLSNSFGALLLLRFQW